MNFLGDGQIEIDNNPTEKPMRGIALERKIGYLQDIQIKGGAYSD